MSKKQAKASGEPAPKKEVRDREKRLKVSVTPTERAEIERRATVAGMSVAGYLRAAALNHPIRSTLDYDAVLALAKVAGDLGRLGGLMKLWLTERRGVASSARDVNAVLQEARALQAEIRERMSTV